MSLARLARQAVCAVATVAELDQAGSGLGVYCVLLIGLDYPFHLGPRLLA